MCCDDYSYFSQINDKITPASKKQVGLFNNIKRINEDFGYNTERTVLTAGIYDRKCNFISIGKNSYIKTHPIQKKFGINHHKIYLHAEIQALVNSLRREKSLKGSSLVIYRLDKQGNDATSFCCDGCVNALKHYEIKNIVFFDKSKGCICSHKLSNSS